MQVPAYPNRGFSIAEAGGARPELEVEATEEEEEAAGLRDIERTIALAQQTKVVRCSPHSPC